MRRRRRAYVLRTHTQSSNSSRSLRLKRVRAVIPEETFNRPGKVIRRITSRDIERIREMGRSDSFKKRPRIVRRRLCTQSVFLTLFGLIATILGYFDLQNQGNVLLFQVLIAILSLAEVVLLFTYAVTVLKYKEYLRLVMLSSPEPTPSLLRSPWVLGGYGVEAVFHLIISPPFSPFPLRELYFPLLLVRNYHILRYIYWSSPISSPRVHILASAAYLKPTIPGIIRSFIANYSIVLVFFVYASCLVISGLILYTFERNENDFQMDYPQNGLWVVAATQTAVGYGDVVPTTLIGKFSIAFNCFLGSFIIALITSSASRRLTLTTNECTLYSELSYMRYRRKHSKPAVILIQRWWRFISNRVKRVRNGEIVVEFYTQLRTHRRGLAAAQTQKDRSFDLMLRHFDESTSKDLRVMREYLAPIYDVTPLVAVT